MMKHEYVRFPSLSKHIKKTYILIPILLFLIPFIESCNQNPSGQEADNQRVIYNSDIPEFTQEDGVLTVLMDNSLTSYFIYQGEAMGYEYEMLKLFAHENDLKLNIKIIGQLENILDSLNAGKGDLVAANLTISKGRMDQVAFTEPLFRTKQILVQRLPDNKRKMTSDNIEKSLVRDRLDLAGKKVMIRKNTSFELMLHNLISETGIDFSIDYAPGDLVTEHLIEMVSNKEIDFTICDLNKAEIFNAYYNNIDIQTPMSLSQPIAWAVNKESTALLSTLNSWIKKRFGSLEFNMIHNKYFDITKRKGKLISKEYDYMKEGKISDYDELMKKYAATINWDWRLLASQMYKESKFDPNTKSWRGATGLMQLMPRTALSHGVQANELNDPEKNIIAGTKHIAMLENHWNAKSLDSVEFIKFTLGSYNVGQGHVEDAIRLAKKYDLNPSIWDDNVAKMLLNKSIPKYYNDPVVKYGYCRGKEPVNYVETILDTFELYKQFTD